MLKRVRRGVATTLFQTQVEQRGAREKFCLGLGVQEGVAIRGGRGVWARDADGREYLDFVAGFGALAHGHCHPRMVEALTRQAERLALAPPAVHSDLLGPACRLLAESTGYARALLLNTAAEAVETAVKFARRSAYDRLGVAANRAVVFVARPEEETRDGPFPFPGFVRIAYDDIAALDAALVGEPCAAAVVVEPVHVGSEVIVPAGDYLRSVVALCRPRRVAVIVDETRTGLGRLGALAAPESERGDFSCLGKAVGGGFFPVAAVCGSATAFDSVFPDCHQLPAAGSPLACAAVLGSLGLLAEERLADNAKAMGEHLLRGLSALVAREGRLRGVRGKGLLLALDVGPPAAVLCDALLCRGVLATAIGPHTILLTPPLTIVRAECDRFLAIAEELLCSPADPSLDA